LWNSASIYYLDGITPVSIIGQGQDITDWKKAEKEILYLSYHDQLTGLYNQRFYEIELKRLEIERNLPFSIVMGDVNGLKLINDSFGHDKGDELLKKVGEVIKSGCRVGDIIARLAGDEFVIILPKTDILETEKIIKCITDLLLNQKVGAINTSIAFGYATKNNEGEKIQEIFKKAEDHMYKRKIFESESIREKTINVTINTLYEKSKREKTAKHLKSMKQNSLRLLTLVNNLINVSKMDSGFYEPTFNNYNIVSIIKKVLYSTRDYSKQKKYDKIQI
jgi:diguanylate cyclase (GGDEF)-like protein